ncbi:MAG TPA: hypothetical protein PKB10_11875 [Tepidisphaeraceae bacterium]|nr:hypothetical protein [Tepidisphaeraceae bacterium]
MARYRVPSNTGKLRVVVAPGGKFAAWNGKTDKNEFRILCRSKKVAEEVARVVNSRAHHGEIDVLDTGVMVPDEQQLTLQTGRLTRKERHIRSRQTDES